MKKLTTILIMLLFVNTYSQIIKKIDPEEGKIRAVSFSHNGKYLAIGTTCAYFSTECVYCYAASDWKRIWSNDNSNLMPSQVTEVKNIRFSNDDKYILSTHKSGAENRLSFGLWNMQGKLSYKFLDYPAINADITLDNKSLILNRHISKDNYSSTAHDWSGKVIVDFIEIENGNKKENAIKNYSLSKKGNYEKSKDKQLLWYDNIVYSSSGNLIILNGFNNEILNWDLNTGEYFVLVSNNELIDLVISISPDGTKAAIANYSENNVIYVWDLKLRTVIKRFKGHNKLVKDLKFSPDGNYLVSASEDETIKIWDIQTENSIKTLKGHSSSVNSLCFSQDAKYLASGSNDGTIIIWDAAEVIPNLKLFIASYDLKYGLSNKLNQDKQIEIDALKDYFKPKGEFETTEDYNLRVNKGKEEVKIIEDKYALMFQESKSTIENNISELEKQKDDYAITKELEKQNTINNSIKDTIVNIASVGTYNADEQLLPLQVKGKNGNIKISVTEAQSFKKSWKDAKAKCKKKLNGNLVDYDYYDIVVIHPITKTEYTLELGQ